MNRNEEYRELLRSLEETPEELEYTVNRALTRERASHKKRRIFGIPAVSLAACFLGFVLLVNLFPPFAYACGRIPMLKELAQTVAWSPSLSAAVENEYVQPVELSQTSGDVTVTVHYVIVDRRQINIFYTADYPESLGESFLMDYDFGPLRGWSGTGGGLLREPGEMKEISLDFVEQNVPDTLDLRMSMSREPGGEALQNEEELLWEDLEPFAEFSFHLEFDPLFTAQGESIRVDETFELDGQKLTLTEVELYPTHLRVHLEDDPHNTAWLKGLDLYLENQKGERFGKSINGITASGDPDGEGFASFWLDSPFFRDSQHLTLLVCGASWREKEGPMVRVDLREGTAENLPDGVLFEGVREEGGVPWVSFACRYGQESTMYTVVEHTFLDEAGNSYEISRWRHTMGHRDPETGERVEEDLWFTESIPLENLRGDVAYLEPSFDRVTEFNPPISVTIR